MNIQYSGMPKLQDPLTYPSNNLYRIQHTELYIVDVEALESLFTDSQLQELRLLFKDCLHLWSRQKNQHGCCSFFLRALFLRKSSDSTGDFITTLSSKGVNNRALTEKLASLMKLPF